MGKTRKSRTAANIQANVAEETKLGRPTIYNAEVHVALVEAYAEEEYTYQKIADRLAIDVDTLKEWRRLHPDFSAALERGKERALAGVVRSLYKRALGYDYEQTELVGKKNAEGGVSAKQMTTRSKHVPPDVAAIMCILTNRDPGNWQHRRELLVKQISGQLGDLEGLTDAELEDLIAGREIGALTEGESQAGAGEEAPLELPSDGDGQSVEASEASDDTV